jgi:hypothetical protein
MADEIDRANDLSEALHAFNVAEARAKANTRELQPVGYCHWCEEDIDDPRKLFCSLACSADHNRYKNRGVK